MTLAGRVVPIRKSQDQSSVTSSPGLIAGSNVLQFRQIDLGLLEIESPPQRKGSTRQSERGTGTPHQARLRGRGTKPPRDHRPSHQVPLRQLARGHIREHGAGLELSKRPSKHLDIAFAARPIDAFSSQGLQGHLSLRQSHLNLYSNPHLVLHVCHWILDDHFHRLIHGCDHPHRILSHRPLTRLSLISVRLFCFTRCPSQTFDGCSSSIGFFWASRSFRFQLAISANCHPWMRCLPLPKEPEGAPAITAVV